MADNLMGTVVDMAGRFDLTLLKIESHKSGFDEYLMELLDEIYH